MFFCLFLWAFLSILFSSANSINNVWMNSKKSKEKRKCTEKTCSRCWQIYMYDFYMRFPYGNFHKHERLKQKKRMQKKKEKDINLPLFLIKISNKMVIPPYLLPHFYIFLKTFIPSRVLKYLLTSGWVLECEKKKSERINSIKIELRWSIYWNVWKNVDGCPSYQTCGT